MKRTIAFDIDSVLFPVNEIAILPALSEHFGRTVEKEEITDFDYRKCWPGPTGEAARAVAFDQFKRADLYDGHMLRPMQLNTLYVLRAAGHRVIVVSSPFQQHASSKWAYCQRAGFKHEDIVLCGDKHLVAFDLLVDDRPETLNMLPDDRAIVYDQPWNQGVQCRRVLGWHEMLPVIIRALT